MPRVSGNRGFALLTVIVLLAFLMAVSATLAVFIRADIQQRGAFQRSLTGFYAAEAGINAGMGTYKNIFLSFNVPSGSDFNAKTITVGDRTVTYQLASVGTPQSVSIPQGQLFAGCNALQSTYNANSKATKISGDVEADVGAQFKVGLVPLFQFLAFYNNDLEIDPGATMTLHGRIHSNGNLYLGPDAQLSILANPPSIPNVQVSTKGDIYRGRKDDGTCNGSATVTIDTQSNTPRNVSCNGGSATAVPVSTLATWNGTIKSEIQSIGVPQPDITTKGGAYWTKADLRIVLRLDETTTVSPPWGSCSPAGCQLYVIEAQNADGTQNAAMTALLHAFMADSAYNSNHSSLPYTQPIYYTDVPATPSSYTASTAYQPRFSSSARVYANVMGPYAGTFDLDYRRGGFFNQREGQWMYLLNINLHDLLDWNKRQLAGNQFFNPADNTDGGIVIYATVEGPQSNTINNYGVRAFGSSNLPFPAVAAGGYPTGVTFITDQAIYVAGDFNRGNTASGDLPWQPAAILGDSLNVLSNNYFNNGNSCDNDCQSNLPLSDARRNATSTTINAAFLAGVDQTILNGGRSTYNGGLENYPRFHESWSGQSLTYLGSFVSLGSPAHVSGLWCGTGNACNIYNPPARNWDYDSRFNTPANLPPLTPQFVYVQQVLFTEDFK